MKKKTILLLCGLMAAIALSLSLSTVWAQGPEAAAEKYPKIRTAIVALEVARKELAAAPHDFGGHREGALLACDKAIDQLKLALASDQK